MKRFFESAKAAVRSMRNVLARVGDVDPETLMNSMNLFA